MTLFDVVLHFKLYDACHINKEFDMRYIYNDTLSQRRGNHSVAFVDNHDTQPGQALESWIPEWFKQQAYALILLHGIENTCVFYGHYYGIPHNNIDKTDKLEEMIWLRSQMKDFNIVDQFDDPDCIGWLVEQEHPMVIVLTNDKGKGKEFSIRGKENKEFIDILHGLQTKTDENGNSVFACLDGSCSIYIEKDYYNRFLKAGKKKLWRAKNNENFNGVRPRSISIQKRIKRYVNQRRTRSN